ncbi:MAG: RluA family pseudouridine synthase [Spirochaetes bacterium]|nr:RluA family pseudouridine synthase [Spirochaetota bacterium]
MIKIIIDDFTKEKRLDKFLIGYFNNASKNFIYKIIRKKKVKVNDKKVDIYYKLKKGDEIKIYISDELLEKNKKEVTEFYKVEEYFLKIIYEDNNIIVVYKPKGVIVHSDQNEKYWILQEFIIKYLIDKNEYNPKINNFVPSPVHRIDRNTEGLVIFAKNYKSHSFISSLFKEKKIEKIYYAFVYGKLEKKIELNLNLIKDEKLKKVFVGKGGILSKTIVEPIKYNDNYSFVKILIETGKMHQIRVSLSHAGYPIIGDDKYGKKEKNKMLKRNLKIDGQLLFANRISFPENIEDKEFKYLERKVFEDRFAYNLIYVKNYFGF